MQELPTFSEVQRDLDPIVPGLYAALEYGAQVNEEFFSERGEVQDPHLFAHLLRFYARRHLESTGGAPDHLELDPQSNNGVLIRYGKYQLRLLKARRNGLPLPGHSQSRLAEYRQAAFFDGFAGWDDRSLRAPVNLLALWDINPQKRVVGLSLALAQAESSDPQSYRCRWMETLPHPTETVSTVALDATVPDSEFEDLPIAITMMPAEDAVTADDDVPVTRPEANDGSATTIDEAGGRHRRA